MVSRYRTPKSSRLWLRLVGGALFIAFIALQVALWGENGLLQLWDLSRSNAVERADTEELKARNYKFAREITDLKQGVDILEERAREDLGMVKPGETFFRIIDSNRVTEDVTK